MDQQRILTNIMLAAVRTRNLAVFHAAIAQGFDVTMHVRSKKSANSMPFVEKVARSSFPDALRALLVDEKPVRISRGDAIRAFHASVASGAPRTIITVFVDASILNGLPVLSLSDCYRYAMEYKCSELARRVVDTPGFNPNAVIQMFAGAWERPIHSAVKQNQFYTVIRLLELGAVADGTDCNGITAMMYACAMLDLDVVSLLLRHDAGPNTGEDIIPIGYPLNVNDTNLPTFPCFNSTIVRNSTIATAKADGIVYTLISAGLKPGPGNWIQKTAVMINMSVDAGLALMHVVYELPTLRDLATVAARRQVRRKISGDNRDMPFNRFLHTLHLPDDVKAQLSIHHN